MKDCCKHNKTSKKCIRLKDNKVFQLPRRFSRKKCTKPGNVRGYTMRSSCAPYKGCISGGNKRKTQKQFLYNPNDPSKSFDVYIDKNPNDTISIKYSTVDDVYETISKLEKLFKNDSYTHKRIWQVAMIMKVRLGAMKKHKKTLYPNATQVNERYNLSKKYFKFLGKRSKEKDHEKRKKMIFKNFTGKNM